VILSAPWAARYGHASVIDAAGAIYVIDGYGYSDAGYDDVWVSTDEGADQTRECSKGTNRRSLPLSLYLSYVV
jgi:hypothetical protein